MRRLPSGAVWLLAAALLSCTAEGLATKGPPPGAVPTSDPAAQGPIVEAGSGDIAALPPSCQHRAGGALPDPACTPGAVDPRVTQANVGSTICQSGYSRTVRPPTSYTTPLKRELMRRYGLSSDLGEYEFDHLVPLAVGGAPTSVHNLWPERWTDTTEALGARTKDGLENYLHREVCAGRIQLADAQRAIAVNWLQAWDQAGRP